MLLGAYQQLAVLQFGLPSLQFSVTFILIQSDLFKLKMHRQDVVEQMIMYDLRGYIANSCGPKISCI